jgi:hypothetical protein
MTWTDEEILYALFILKANHYDYDGLTSLNVSEEYICGFVGVVYADLFADRAMADEEFEFYLNNIDYEILNEKPLHMSLWISAKKARGYDKKIRLSFID